MEAASEDSRMALAMVHLLSIASRDSLISPSDAVKRSAMVSLRVIQRSISSSSSSSSSSLRNLVFQGLTACMPYLLSLSQKSVVMKSAEVLGDMALSSYETAVQILHDKAVIKTLLSLLMVKHAGIVIEACHVITNLSACRLGRTVLYDFGAVRRLLLLISLIAETISGSEVDKPFDLNTKWHSLPRNKDIMFFAILDTLNALTHNDFYECLRMIPKGKHTMLLQRFQALWKRFCHHGCLIRNKVHVLCKVIVWLAMEQEVVYSDGECGEALHCLFGGMKDDFEHFWDSHWEKRPFFMTKAKSVEDEARANLFGEGWSSGKDKFAIKEFMTRALACPLFSADEVEASKVYEEIEENLGKSLIFEQDIRLVKSVNIGIGTVQEIDYHKVTSDSYDTKDPLLFADIDTCINAYNSGYTIALRGMEFRSPHVAMIAEELAICFGQVTVGANMYLTPSNAQGFKPHLDDHCIFVWQIIGSKAWKIWSSKYELPRLYTQHVEVSNNYEEDALSLILNEGSVLYIPRGFPHEATTEKQTLNITEPLVPCIDCKVSSEDLTTNLKPKYSNGIIAQECEECRDKFKVASPVALTGTDVVAVAGRSQKRLKDSHETFRRETDESLHITFGVEIEPPFDWEGFVHMSLHSWAENQNWNDILDWQEASVISTKRFGELCTGLLHVAVRSCGDKFFILRKACLVAAKPLLLHHQKIKNDSLESFFQSLIVYIGQKADFNEAFDILLSAIDRKEGSSLDWMCWLRHLPCQGKPNVWSEPMSFFRERLMDCRSAESLKHLEAGFINAKNTFVSCGSFSEAQSLFVTLLYKYRNVRKRYTNGMLALQV